MEIWQKKGYDGGIIMSKYKVKINDNDYEVDINDLGDGNLEIKIGEKTVNLTIEEVLQTKDSAPMPKPKIESKQAEIDPTPKPIPEPVTTAAKGKGEVVKSVMSGTIISLKKKVGDTVQIGDVVLIIEAMKMENEISSPIEGKILEIKVSPGNSVHTGDEIFVVG